MANSNSMTMRERMLRVIQGRAADRVPFVQYDWLVPIDEAWRLLGRENLGLIHWTRLHRFDHPNCRFESEPFARDGIQGIRTTLHTPLGSLEEEKYLDPVYQSPSIHSHFVKNPEDYAILRFWLEDIEVQKDTVDYEKTLQLLGEDGLPHVSVGRTPFQQLWIEWVNLQDLSLHMVQIPDVLEPVIEQLTRIQRRIFEIIVGAPIPYAIFPDNITASVMGPSLFARYCVPAYRELHGMLAERGVPVLVHTDGDLKPLWPLIGEAGFDGFESLSPPPDNDTSPAAALERWPAMRLLVNFPSSVHLRRPEQIREAADALLAQAGHSGRLQIQISENVPPEVWRQSYPVIVQAITDFGTP